MRDKDLLKRKTIVNRILIVVIIALVLLGIVSYKKYYDEKREREIGETIKNAMADTPTIIEKAEKALSVMDRMSFSGNGNVLFISIYNIDDELKLDELFGAIEETREEVWFLWDYAVVDIFHYKLGMATSIEINVETMEIRDCDWYDEKN